MINICKTKDLHIKARKWFMIGMFEPGLELGGHCPWGATFGLKWHNFGSVGAENLWKIKVIQQRFAQFFENGRFYYMKIHCCA